MSELSGELRPRAVGSALVTAEELSLPDPDLDLSDFTGDLDELLLEIVEAQGGVTPDPTVFLSPEKKVGG